MSLTPLSSDHVVAEFLLNDFVVRYELREGTVEFSTYPCSKSSSLVPRRKTGRIHPELSVRKYREVTNDESDSLVQIGLRGQPSPKSWLAGGTMRNSAVTEALQFVEQVIREDDKQLNIETWLESEIGFRICHKLTWDVGDLGVRIETSVCNTGLAPLPVEMLSSFSLTGITPFSEDDASGRLHLHRFRSTWSNEGQHTIQSLEELGLERTWAGLPSFLRFGQVGSLPVRNFHPWLGVEDSVEGVMWAATVAWHGSWQMEVMRRDDPVTISGGLGDYEFAHWMKEIQPGETFTAPLALLAVCEGGIDDISGRLVELQRHLEYEEPEHEKGLPIIFNEWCSSWGYPTHDYILRTADRLEETETRYLVIDDGWAEKPDGADIQFNGDWNLDTTAFPDGLKVTADAIRQRGLIPGIWFEFEPCTEGTKAFSMTDHQLQRHGVTLQCGSRHFWDFRDPWTEEYLTRKVINLLRDSGIGYLKVDYNESIGLGCDGAESLGEGLRQHLVQVKKFFEKIRREIPGIVIENCSSGGHRLEPGMVGVTSMSSFSDAHESVEIPIIAAQLHRIIPVHKNQVWAVLRPDDTLERIKYSLAATFLGRMCISGDIVDLSDERFAILKEAQAFYSEVTGILACGRSNLYGSSGASRRYPTGWQGVIRESLDLHSALFVYHSFDSRGGDKVVEIDLPNTNSWRIDASFNLPQGVVIEHGKIRIPEVASFTGFACKLIG